MSTQKYLDLKAKHEKEISDFPIAYAFSDEQLQEALKKLGATKEECVTIFGHGDIVKKENASKLIALFKHQVQELKDMLVADEEFAEAAFLYEMDNHEYAINYDGDEDVLRCFGLDEDDLIEMNLERAYLRARNKHMEHAREWF